VTPPWPILRADLRRRVRWPGAGEMLVLERVSAIDGSGSAPLENATIVLRGGRIDQVVPSGGSVDLPDEPRPERLDLAGAFVTPGLIDCHVHLTGIVGDEAGFERFPGVRTLRAAYHAALVLAAGFTTVRHLGHGDPDHTQAVRDAIRGGVNDGPRILTSRWALSASGGHGNLRAWPIELVHTLRPRSAFVDGTTAARKFVRQLIGDGADCVKLYATEGVLTTPERRSDVSNFTRAELEAIVEEAHRRGRRVAAHATGSLGARRAVEAGVDTIEHGPAAVDTELLRLMARAGTTFVPTLALFEWAANGSLELPAWASARAAAQLDQRRTAVRCALELGVNVAAGTDSGPPGPGQNAREIAALVRAGLSPLQALSAATKSAAIALGLADRLGSIVPGQEADLVVWRADPREMAVVLDPASIQLILQSGYP
jgi:imidazolonepropionase-like amidohydrolase